MAKRNSVLVDLLPVSRNLCISFKFKYQLMENLENGQNIRNALSCVVVDFKTAQENVTVQLLQMVVQIVMATGLKHVNVLSSRVL